MRLVRLAVVGLCACSGALEEGAPQSDAGDATSAVDAAEDVVDLIDAPPVPPDADVPYPPCPATSPSAGDPCDALGQRCEYGTPGQLACNTLASCSGRGCNRDKPPYTWSLERGARCEAGACGCPQAYGEAGASQRCPASCSYAEGTCACTVIPEGPYWQCTPAPPTCPATRPLLGTACDAGRELCPIPAPDQPAQGCCNTFDQYSCRGNVWVAFASSVCITPGPPPPCDPKP